MHPSSSVLIVDDLDQDLKNTTQLLETAGVRPPFVTAEGAQQAQELLKKEGHLFHLAFVDLRMPICDGLQLLAWVRERPELAHLKVVIITGDNDAEQIGRARELGAAGYFSKYPSAPKLAAILSAIVPEALSADAAPSV